MNNKVKVSGTMRNLSGNLPPTPAQVNEMKRVHEDDVDPRSQPKGKQKKKENYIEDVIHDFLRKYHEKKTHLEPDEKPNMSQLPELSLPEEVDECLAPLILKLKTKHDTLRTEVATRVEELSSQTNTMEVNLTVDQCRKVQILMTNAFKLADTFITENEQKQLNANKTKLADVFVGDDIISRRTKECADLRENVAELLQKYGGI
jgi:hypothetical protein